VTVTAARDSTAPGFLASAPMRLSLAAAALYCLGMALAWAAFSTQMPVDWGFELILTQEIKPFYAVSNPPLYSWIAWALQQVLPPGQAILLIVNYLATFALFCLTAFAGHRVLKDRMLAASAPWSLFVIIPYGRLNFGYVNTQLLLPLILASVVILLAIGRRPRWSLFAALGLAVGLGALAKLNYLFAIACLLGAACLQPRLRAGLVSPWIALSLVLALAVIAPFGVAFHEAGNDLMALLHSKTAAGAPLSYGAQVASGLASTGAGMLKYLGPALAIGLAGALLVRGGSARDEERAAGGRFLRDALIIGLVVILAGIFVFGIARLKIWYLHAFFLLAPVYALSFWDKARVPDILRLALCGVVLGFVVVQTATRLIEFTPYCQGKCRDLVPYDGLAQHLRQAGFERGTIISSGVRVGGNLRPHFPRARIGTMGPHWLPRRAPGPIGQCLVIWRDDEVESETAARLAAAQTLIALGLPVAAGETPVRSVRLALRGWPASGRPGKSGAVVWHYILIKKGNARCG
jgi:hypothetical protein